MQANRATKGRVNRAVTKHTLTADVANHLVEMPARRRRRSAALEFGGDLRTELDRPAAHGLLADTDSPLSQQLFDVPKTQGETEVEPDRMTDHIGWKAVTLEGKSRHWGPLSPKTGRSRDHSALA